MRPVRLLALLGAVLLAVPAFAQEAPRAEISTMPSSEWPIARIAAKVQNAFTGNERFDRAPSLPYLSDEKGHRLFAIPGADSIGQTWYDFQTNGAMPNRIINWPNDQLPADLVTSTLVWMVATSEPPEYTNRGTFGKIRVGEGEEASWVPFPDIGGWEPIEATKAGFPSIDYIKNGEFAGSVVMTSHANNESGVNIIVELTPGSGDFFVRTIPNSAQGFWPRIAVDGDGVFHAIWTYPATTGAGQPHPNNGILKYSRSDDQGGNWTPPIDLSGANAFNGGVNNGQGLPKISGGDAYAIDAAGSNVVIWMGPENQVSVTQMHSTNNGQFWTIATSTVGPRYTRVYAQHSDPDSVYYRRVEGDSTVYRSDTGMAPTNTDFDVMITEDGVIYGAVSVIPTYFERYHKNNEDTSASTYRFNGLNYFTGLAFPDRSFRFVRFDTTNGFSYHNIPAPEEMDTSGRFLEPRGIVGLTRWPQLGMRDNGDVFVLFSGPENDDFIMADDTSDNVEGERKFYRSHAYITYTRNQGETWETPRNLTPNGVDAQYGSLADLIDDEAHIAIQTDDYPSDYLTTSDTVGGSSLHPRVQSTIEAMILPVGSITGVGNSSGSVSTLSIATPSPNPARTATTVEYSVDQSTENASLVLYNTLGQAVRTLVDGRRVAGKYVYTFDVTGLENGAYYLVLTANGQTATSKLTVTH